MAITVATGGSALPIIASVAIGTAVTAGMNAGVTAIKGGSGEDILNSALDGASDGFMWSGVFAFGGATINAIKASGQGVSLNKASIKNSSLDVKEKIHWQGKGNAPMQNGPVNGSYVKNTPVGKDVAYYNGQGQQYLRIDVSHSHGGMQPHAHLYEWSWHNGVWRYIKGKVIPWK